MATLNRHLSNLLKTGVEERAVMIGHSCVNHYIVALIEADLLTALVDMTDADLIRGLDSGPAVDVTPEFLNAVKYRARTE